jgi:hypothetical protein
MIVGAPTSPYPWCDPKEPVSLSIARRTQALPILRRLDRNCSAWACVGHFEFGIACIAAI